MNNLAHQVSTDSNNQNSHFVDNLKTTVKNIDSLSQHGFSQISSIAKLAICRLEAPLDPCYLDDVVNALTAIREKADDMMNIINCEAENVGCHYVDESELRRMAVRKEYSDYLAAKP